IGVIGLAIFEKQQESFVLKQGNNLIPKKYQLSVLAITFPILYALIDGLGTFLDGVYLDEMGFISEDNARLAYEFTFFIGGVVSCMYVRFIKKETFHIFKDRDQGFAALLEAGGQFFYRSEER